MLVHHIIENELNQAIRATGISPEGKEPMEEMLKKYPASSLLHLLYLQTIKKEEPVSLTRAIKQHAIYFSNLPWLHFLLEEKTEHITGDTPNRTADAQQASTGELIPDKMSQLLEQQAKALQETPAEDTPVEVTPVAYHRIDYFASQGIRLEEQSSSQNAMDMKVRRFTDWLKEMKRIHPHPVDLGTGEESTAQVAGFAASSLEAKEEVVTEAMAEVLLKQGKPGEAKAIYEKLSLMDPSKSTYFAAKIENLNLK